MSIIDEVNKLIQVEEDKKRKIEEERLSFITECNKGIDIIAELSQNGRIDSNEN